MYIAPILAVQTETISDSQSLTVYMPNHIKAVDSSHSDIASLALTGR
jgi:hypothetical protein